MVRLYRTFSNMAKHNVNMSFITEIHYDEVAAMIVLMYEVAAMLVLLLLFAFFEALKG